MKKLAIFAEGGTEQAFVEKLLIEVAGKNNICIRKEKAWGGSTSIKRQRRLVAYAGAREGFEYYVRIVDCGNDDRVTSDIRSAYDGLCRERYDCIIGIRDARGNKDGIPVTVADVPRMRRWMNHGIKTSPIAPIMVLAVMETEAWFLAEHTHFEKIDGSLTLAHVTAVLGFNPSVGDVESRPQPAEDLHRIYSTAGKAYLPKTPTGIQSTVDAIDYSRVFLELGNRVLGLGSLVSAIDGFLRPPATVE